MSSWQKISEVELLAAAEYGQRLPQGAFTLYAISHVRKNSIMAENQDRGVEWTALVSEKHS